jgi:2-octaprenyl-6-methoxyphenol hydroxylase
MAQSIPDSPHLAVIGAGPVGLALALLLARRCPQWQVSLFDARPLHADVSQDPRTLALALGSVQLLRQLGAFPEQGTQPILEVQVSQEAPAVALAGSKPEVRIRADEMGVPELGAVMAYGALVPALQAAWQAEQARQPHRLHHRFGHPVRGLKVVGADEGAGHGGARQGGAGHGGASWAGGSSRSALCRVEVDAGCVETFELAVVAEGGVFMRQAAKPELDIVDSASTHEDGATGPWPRWRAGWERHQLRHDYGQTAWVGTVALDGGTPGLAVERFSRQGPVALLPLPQQAPGAPARASLVWCVDAREDPVASLNDAQRMAVLNALLPPSAGRVVHIGPLKSFPLGLQAQTSLVRSGCLVRIGNAAQTLHPVAGQGLNLGLRDAHALAERLRLAQRRGQSLADALASVHGARAADRWSMIAATDFLARSFTWSLPGAATARALGLLAVEHLPGLKPALARQMMFGRR